MDAQIGMEQCLAFINCQLKPAAQGWPKRNGTERRAITISRQTGSGGHAVAERLAQYLQQQSPDEACPWTVFDRELVEKVLEDHHLPKRLARFMPEDRVSEMADTLDELFGLHPPSWMLVRKAADTILHLAELGNVILVGHGAQVVTSRLNHVFHVRLVGSLGTRIKHLQEQRQVSAKAAQQFLLSEDRGRRRYLQKYFGKDIDDPLLYHLIINTDLVSFDQAARLIGDYVLAKRPGPERVR